MSNISKIAELISQKQGNPLKDILLEKLNGSVNVGKYLNNNNIPRESVGPIKLQNFEDAVNYGKMGLNNYAHDLSNAIEDPSSMKDYLLQILSKETDPERIISRKRADAGKAGLTTSALLALLLNNTLNEDEEESYNF